MPDLTIKFNTQEQLDAFATWMCEQGEQDYFQWMEYRSENVVKSFEYSFEYKQTTTLKENVINTK